MEKMMLDRSFDYITSSACTKYVSTNGSTTQNHELAQMIIAIMITNDTAKYIQYLLVDLTVSAMMCNYDAKIRCYPY